LVVLAIIYFQTCEKNEQERVFRLYESNQDCIVPVRQEDSKKYLTEDIKVNRVSFVWCWMVVSGSQS
jgi:hypothetical protein